MMWRMPRHPPKPRHLSLESAVETGVGMGDSVCGLGWTGGVRCAVLCLTRLF